MHQRFTETWKVLYAKQSTPDQKSGCFKGTTLHCGDTLSIWHFFMALEPSNANGTGWWHRGIPWRNDTQDYDLQELVGMKCMVRTVSLLFAMGAPQQGIFIAGGGIFLGAILPWNYFGGSTAILAAPHLPGNFMAPKSSIADHGAGYWQPRITWRNGTQDYCNLQELLGVDRCMVRTDPVGVSPIRNKASEMICLCIFRLQCGNRNVESSICVVGVLNLPLAMPRMMLTRELQLIKFLLLPWKWCSREPLET